MIDGTERHLYVMDEGPGGRGRTVRRCAMGPLRCAIATLLEETAHWDRVTLSDPEGYRAQYRLLTAEQADAWCSAEQADGVTEEPGISTPTS